MTEPRTPAKTMTFTDSDSLLDSINMAGVNSARRDRAIEKALDAGNSYCSCCGKAIKNFSKAIRVTFTDSDEVAWFGSECAKRI